MTIRRALIIFLTLITLVSCKQKRVDNTAATTKADNGGYWSIIQFGQDQWQTFHGQPFTLEKIVTENGKTDSTYVPAFQMDWGEIFNIFFKSDISDKKFIDHYNFSSFDEDVTGKHTFYYEAKDPDLYTRKLQISIDPTTNKIVSIYIETQQSSKYDGLSYKLYYAPMKLIQIQEFDNTHTKPIQRVTEYRFL